MRDFFEEQQPYSFQKDPSRLVAMARGECQVVDRGINADQKRPCAFQRRRWIHEMSFYSSSADLTKVYS
ncbi:hypothetical protein KIN20_019761 [Parelaphostrongylus tenuis]|uniref:Uncharacterized protein n=1 Tax=Parelaphostrongylus tenuis TaxID=148309 RepID=A0AAD5MLI7_PARTN|nr:hypothetical protein KIN20_019761 [Parelaphostrongylus tenuis]